MFLHYLPNLDNYQNIYKLGQLPYLPITCQHHTFKGYYHYIYLDVTLYGKDFSNRATASISRRPQNILLKLSKPLHDEFKYQQSGHKTSISFFFLLLEFYFSKAVPIFLTRGLIHDPNSTYDTPYYHAIPLLLSTSRSLRNKWILEKL